MDLIVDQVMELEIVHDADSYGVVERLARSAVVKCCLAGERDARHFLEFGDIGFVGAVENGRHDLDAELPCRVAEVYFKHLTDVHTRRNAQRIENYIERSTVREERHVFRREYA